MSNVSRPARSPVPARLAPPPRHIPLALQMRVLGNLAVLIGCAIIVVGFIVATFLYPLTGLQTNLALARDTQQTQGTVHSAEETNFRINNQMVYRVHYTFTLPDDSTFTGKSYTRTSRPRPGSRVTVEYNPDNPSASRVQRHSVTLGPWWAMLIFFIPGLLIITGGLLWGRTRVRLLRIGQLAIGRITAGLIVMPSSTSKQRAYKNVLATSDSRTLTGFAFGPIHELHEQVAKLKNFNPFAQGSSPLGPDVFKLMIKLWMAFAAIIFLIGLVIVVAFALRSQDTGVRTVGLVFVLVWIIGFVLMMYALSAFRRRLEAGPNLFPTVQVRCEFEFPGPDGQPVKTSNDLRYHPDLGQLDEPVLYDPARPASAVLLRAVPGPVEISLSGHLQSTAPLVPNLLRAALPLALLVGAISFYLAS